MCTATITVSPAVVVIHFLLSFGNNYYIIYIHCHYHSLSRCRSLFIFSSHSVAIIISSMCTATITVSPAVAVIHFLISFGSNYCIIPCALPLSQPLPLSIFSSHSVAMCHYHSLWFIFSSHSVAIIISFTYTATITASPAVHCDSLHSSPRTR